MNIISLTSYGQRVYDSCYRACATLLDQTKKVDKVVLYIDQYETPAPKNLLSLQDLGLEIRHRKRNIGSYSKLIWALYDFPNDNIIVADDDLYYERTIIERILSFSEVNPGCIVCQDAYPMVVQDNELTRIHWHTLVKDWADVPDLARNYICCPRSGYGTLYPPNCLYQDVFNEQLFLKLSPRSDEIWFWAQSVLKGTNTVIIPRDKPYKELAVNIALDGAAGNTALWRYNIRDGNYKWQHQAIYNHYPQLKELLK